MDWAWKEMEQDSVRCRFTHCDGHFMCQLGLARGCLEGL